MATMEDIAIRAGVNRATVSNVLNGRFKARRADAARRAANIRKIAEELGYRPNLAARATRTGSTGFVGMIRSPRMDHSVHVPEFESGVDEALHAHGLCLVRDLIDENPTGSPTVPRIVREKAVDGLLVNYAYGTPASVRKVLDRCKIPAVWINRKRDENCVHPDDEGAARLITEHLLSLGHTDIGFVLQSTAEQSDRHRHGRHYSLIDRLAGYRSVLADAGLQPRVIDYPAIADLPDARKPGHVLRSFIELLGRPDRPTAFICEGNGRDMLHAAAIAGVSVPDDLSVITFDNNASADQRIAVDRVLVRYHAMGNAAVHELLALIESDAHTDTNHKQPTGPRKPVVIPFEFHTTGTTARPRR
ncbi:MAG: LacI family DNA-binding transcriptional regulator [Planctomycetota bacterium]